MADAGNWCEKLREELSFHFLTPEETAELASWLDCRSVAPGEVLWRQGDVCAGVAFIVSGQIEVRQPTSFPDKSVIVALLGPGSFVGEFCLLQESERFVTVASREGAELLVLSRRRFEQLAQDRPRLAVRLMQGMLLTVSRRLGQAYERLAAFF